MGLTIFVALWILFSAYSVYQMISMMAVTGNVTVDDRIAVFLALTPLSYLTAPSIALVEVCFFVNSQVDKFKARPEYIQWSIERKIRKRRRGPLVRIVEHLHNKRKEQRHEEDLPAD